MTWYILAHMPYFHRPGHNYLPCAAIPGNILPSLVALTHHYYCESGTAYTVPDLDGYYFSDPLWNGSDRPTNNTCCDNPQSIMVLQRVG